MTARRVGDRVRVAGLGLFSTQVEGAITEVHEVPDHPALNEYSVEWDDGKYPNEIWDENDFDPDFGDE